MKQKKDAQRLQTIAFHSASPSIEGTFAAAARSVFGKLTVRQLDGDLDGVAPRALDRALLVMAHPEMPRNVSALRQLRRRDVRGPALLLAQSAENGDFEADLAELGPAAAFPSEGFAPEDLETCMRALGIAAAPDFYLCRVCPYARRCWENDR